MKNINQILNDGDVQLMKYIHERIVPDQKHILSHPVRIGVIGFSSTPYDKATAQSVIHWELLGVKNEFERNYEHCVFEIVSGLTDIGIPGQAYRIAKTTFGNDIKSVGYACSKAKDFPQFPVDEKHIIGNNWGDESDEFLANIDVLIRIGGGSQSMKEVKMFKEKYPDKLVREYDFD